MADLRFLLCPHLCLLLLDRLLQLVEVIGQFRILDVATVDAQGGGSLQALSLLDEGTLSHSSCSFTQFAGGVWHFEFASFALGVSLFGFGISSPILLLTFLLLPYPHPLLVLPVLL